MLGAALIESCILSFTIAEEQLPVPVLVKYNFKEPFEISEALGENVVVNELAFPNDPVPVVDQTAIPLVAVPFKDKLFPEQTAAVALPASTVGRGVIVTIILSTAVEDIPVTVNFNLTDPAALSAALGV